MRRQRNRQLYKRVKILKNSSTSQNSSLVRKPACGFMGVLCNQAGKAKNILSRLHQTHSNNLSILLWFNCSNNTNSFRDGDNFRNQERNVSFLFNFVKQTKNTNVHIESLIRQELPCFSSKFILLKSLSCSSFSVSAALVELTSSSSGFLFP